VSVYRDLGLSAVKPAGLWSKVADRNCHTPAFPNWSGFGLAWFGAVAKSDARFHTLAVLLVA